MEGISLPERARLLRVALIKMLAAAPSGHTAGPLGMAEIYAALYFQILNHRPKEPLWPERDRLILSCGHTTPIRYVAMAQAGYFPESELGKLRRFGSQLQGHPSRVDLPALETSSGPLGQGLSLAVGMALEAKRTNQSWHTYCILSDGEHQEGQTWEAILLAGARKLPNLTAIVDRNQIQISGPTETVLPLADLAEKYRSFGWSVRTANGNHIDEVLNALEELRSESGPRVLIANTTPGKGVSFMENDYRWHGKTPTEEEANRALAELGEGG